MFDMAKKYYAVAKGKVPGIYMTWDDCKKQVEHFSGAVYKSFPNIQEAERFIEAVNGTEPVMENIQDKTVISGVEGEADQKRENQPVSTEEHLIAYVDGSYEHNRKRYAYGCVLVLPGEVITLNGSGAEEDYVSMRNVAGEILGSEQAINWGIEHGYKQITIYYDYEGIEKWANGIWKANKPGTKRYQAFVAEKRREIRISFHKVAAHTGVTYNEMADRLAKEALGL